MADPYTGWSKMKIGIHMRSGSIRRSWPLILVLLATLTTLGVSACFQEPSDPSAPESAKTPAPPVPLPTAKPPAPTTTTAGEIGCCQWEVEGEKRCSDGNYKDVCEKMTFKNNKNEEMKGEFFKDRNCKPVEAKLKELPFWGECQ